VVDNGSGISSSDYDSVGLKHHTSKLSSFEDLTTVTSFGFRGEALSSLCATCESVCITTATESEAPMGTILELDDGGRCKSKSKKVARPVRSSDTCSELLRALMNFNLVERYYRAGHKSFHIPSRTTQGITQKFKKRIRKGASVVDSVWSYPLHQRKQRSPSHSLQPTWQEVWHVLFPPSDRLLRKFSAKSVQLRTDGSTSLSASVNSIWGPKAMQNMEKLNLTLTIVPEKSVLRRLGAEEQLGVLKSFKLGNK
jgi:DNA mismatch repair protein PMS2